MLRAGPTSWGTVLQLPDSWVEAVSTAQLPEEQPLSTALEVGLSCHTGRHTSIEVQHASTVKHAAVRSIAG